MAGLMDASLTSLRQEAPKALLGLIIPAAQLAWKMWQDRRIPAKREALRARIQSLAQFQSVAFGHRDDSDDILKDARLDFETAVRELVSISSDHLASARLRGSARPLPQNPLQRWFLLYLPRQRSAWLPHAVFFGSLGLVLLIVRGLTEPFESADVFLWTLLALVIGWLLLIRQWAVSADTGRDIPLFARWPLLAVAASFTAISLLAIVAAISTFVLFPRVPDLAPPNPVPELTIEVPWLVVMSAITWCMRPSFMRRSSRRALQNLQRRQA
jgi:hypothetical protein